MSEFGGVGAAVSGLGEFRWFKGLRLTGLGLLEFMKRSSDNPRLLELGLEVFGLRPSGFASGVLWSKAFARLEPTPSRTEPRTDGELSLGLFS